KGVLMALLKINPDYRGLLASNGLATPADFLRLSGIIYSGYPDRHVAHLVLGEGADAVAVFLKREHRVPWRDRLTNLWQGFGFVSKSVREYLLLHQLRRAG